MSNLYDALTREDIIELMEKTNSRYLETMIELSRYRNMYDKVKPEDLCSTVQERELVFRNEIELLRSRLEVANSKLERILGILTT